MSPYPNVIFTEGQRMTYLQTINRFNERRVSNV